MATDWSKGAWGLLVPKSVKAGNFENAIAGGATFAIFEMNSGYQQYNDNGWAEMLDLAYRQGMRIFGLVYNWEISKIPGVAQDLPNWGYPGGLNDDNKMVQEVYEWTKNKFAQMLIFQHGNWSFVDPPKLSEKPTPTWYQISCESLLRYFEDHLKTKVPPHRMEKIIPMVPKSLLDDVYPDCKGTMAGEISCVDYNLFVGKTIDIGTDWSQVPGYLKSSTIQPPNSYSEQIVLWKWANSVFTSPDFKKEDGSNASMGIVSFNAPIAALESFTKSVRPVVSIPTPEPEPIPDPEPEPIPDPVSVGPPFGIDISRHQGDLNWDVIAANPNPRLVRFVAIRAGVSWGYVDDRFARNWSEAKRVGIPRMAYHVWYPDQPNKNQVDAFAKIVGSDIGEMPVVADVELDRGLSPTRITSALIEYLALLEEKFGRPPIIYSRASWIDVHIIPSFCLDYGNNYKWYVAHYHWLKGVERTAYPAIPKNIRPENVIIHQTSDSIKAIGGTGDTMDANRWLLTEAELKAMIIRPDDPTTPPTVPPTTPPEFKVYVDNINKEIVEKDKHEVTLKELWKELQEKLK